MLLSNLQSHNSARITNCCVHEKTIYILDFANSGKRKPKKKNLTADIVNSSKTIEDAFKHKLIRGK